jgi:hypothetical protein
MQKRHKVNNLLRDFSFSEVVRKSGRDDSVNRPSHDK